MATCRLGISFPSPDSFCGKFQDRSQQWSGDVAPLAGPGASARVPPPGCGSTFVPQVPDDLNLLRLRAVLGCPGGGSGFSWLCRALTPVASRGCADSMWDQGQGWWGGS